MILVTNASSSFSCIDRESPRHPTYMKFRANNAFQGLDNTAVLALSPTLVAGMSQTACETTYQHWSGLRVEMHILRLTLRPHL